MTMNKIYYFLLFALVGCAKNFKVEHNDLEELNLKGKVKSIYEYNPNNTNLDNNSIYIFNKLGLIIFNKDGFNEEKSSYIYNFENGKVNSYKTISKYKNKEEETISKYIYSKDKYVINTYKNDILISKTIEKYDENLLINKYSYRYDYKGNNPYLNYHNKFTYNNENQLINQETYLWKYGTKEEFLDWKDEFFYNEKESEPVRKEVAIFDEFPNKYRYYTFDTSYKYDKQGNWVMLISKDKKTIMKKRIITYYE